MRGGYWPDPGVFILHIHILLFGLGLVRVLGGPIRGYLFGSGLTESLDPLTELLGYCEPFGPVRTLLGLGTWPSYRLGSQLGGGSPRLFPVRGRVVWVRG